MNVSEISFKEELQNFDWNFENSTSQKIHSLHPYPAKFIPEIPKTLIGVLPIPDGTLILDPFCGSGVTLLEAQNAGIESVGIDLNPIACLLANVKTKPLPANFLNITEEIVKNCKTFRGIITIPEIPNLDHWFKKDIQNGLAILIKEISVIKNMSTANALKFCFSSIIVKVSNQESDTRYAAIENKWEKTDVFNLFMSVAERLVKAKVDNTKNIESTIINKNALDILTSDFKKKVGLVITSPPYPNAYEYWLYHKYRMWWLGYDPIGVKEMEIGARAHYFKKNHQTINDFVLQMEILFQNLYKVCSNGAFICFVIGRSKIHGEIFENEKIIAKIGVGVGLKYFTTLKRTIKSDKKSFNLSHARIKEEFIVILKK